MKWLSSQFMYNNITRFNNASINVRLVNKYDLNWLKASYVN
jgi:hypothetical protein